MVKRLIIATVLLGLIGGGLIWFNFFRDQMIAQFFENMPVQALPVETVQAEAVTWQPVIAAIGTANAAQGVDLTVEAAGIVREIQFAANDAVEAGQVLVRLDDQVQAADLEAARTQLVLERTNLARQQELQSRGVASNVSLDQARAGFDAAEAQIARATAIIEQRRLTAPFAGTIGLPRVDIGQYVSPGTTIATLQDLDTMRVDFSLPEQSLPDIFIGQTLHVGIEGAERAFDGEITGIDPRVDPSSRMVAVRGTIANPQSALTPGQFVRLHIDLPEETGVVAVPQTAVISSLYGDYVYVVRPREDAEGREVRQTFVKTGRRSSDRIEIVSGVEAGDLIVTAGQNRLSNRAPVTLETEAGS